MANIVYFLFFKVVNGLNHMNKIKCMKMSSYCDWNDHVCNVSQGIAYFDFLTRLSHVSVALCTAIIAPTSSNQSTHVSVLHFFNKKKKGWPKPKQDTKCTPYFRFAMLGFSNTHFDLYLLKIWNTHGYQRLCREEVPDTWLSLFSRKQNIML